MTDGGLRQIFRQYLPEFDWQAIETSTGLGVPDNNACYKGREFWIEFKLARGRRVQVRPEQIGWAERRLRAGGKVFVAVRKDDKLSLFTGWALRDLKTKCVADVASLGTWDGGPSAWQWLEIAGFLTI